MTSADTIPPASTETADVETSSADYALRFAGPTGAWFLQVQERAMLKMLAPYPRTSVLDVGGGHGQLTGGLLRQGHQVEIFGSSEACRARVQPFLDAGRVSFMAGDLLNLPYPDQAFDVVISFRLLPHVRLWRRLVAELARVAKKAILIDFPTFRSLNCLTPVLFSVKKRLEGNTRPYTLFNEDDLVRAFRAQGVCVAGRHAEFLLPMVFHRQLNAPGFSSIAERLMRLTGLTSLFGSPVILHLARDAQVTR